MTKKKIDTTFIRNELEQSRLFTSRVDKEAEKHVEDYVESNVDARTDIQTVRQTDSKVGGVKLPSTDEVEEVLFRFRKEKRTRFSGAFPESWKTEMDEYAHKARVGKYDLIMYAVGKFLGKF